MRILSLILATAFLTVPQIAHAGQNGGQGHHNCDCKPSVMVTPNGMSAQRVGSVTIYRGSNPTPDFAAIAARKAESERAEREAARASEARMEARETNARLARLEAQQAELSKSQEAEKRGNINRRLYGYGQSYRGNNRFFGRNGFVGNSNFSGASVFIGRSKSRGGRKKG